MHTQEFVKKTLDIDNPVKHLKLQKQCFSCEGAEEDLYFYHEDLMMINEETRERGKQKLDTLLALAKKRGLKFVFLVPSDKYTLYKQFATDNPFESNGQLDYYVEYNENDMFLNCKELLAPYVRSGVKDLYKCNDTHWSIKASSIVATELKRRLDNLSNVHEQ